MLVKKFLLSLRKLVLSYLPRSQRTIFWTIFEETGTKLFASFTTDHILDYICGDWY